jgi:RNA polymerase sigma-70 factor (ECF subfamily)
MTPDRTPDTSAQPGQGQGVVVGVRPVVEVDRRQSAQLLLAEAPVILAMLRSVCRNEAEADDILGATIEIALRHQLDLRSPDALRPWLARIALREAFRLRRRLARVVRLPSLGRAQPATAGPGPESIAVRAALTNLPTRARAAVVLHHMLGFSVAETAAALSTSPNTVKTQLRVGLASLREELRDE